MMEKSPINRERKRRIDEVFAAALDAPAEERQHILDRECGGDAELRREVESMLACEKTARAFLDTPADVDATVRLPAPVVLQNSRKGRFVPGDLIAGRYRLASRLGRGGMGEVYLADDLKLGQQVAMKFLDESLAGSGSALARFHREVSLARQVSHRHVCRVYDIGEHAGMHFLTMEYIRGEELSSLLKRVGRLPAEKAVETARQLCSGLAAIHAAGVLHRDLKPANVMIDECGDVRITDFGVAALSEGVSGAEAMTGTPLYMAPEQLSGGKVTTRSDIYALGLVLYEAFTGSRPFKAETLEEIARSRLADTTPIRPSAFVAEVEPSVERTILRCLEKDPERRPASAVEVVASLPGGDPLAAAVAAGETPSPQMVAGAATEGSLRPSVAIPLLVSILAGFLIVALLAERTTLHEQIPLELSPELLRASAAAIAKDAGYTASTSDVVSGFELDQPVVLYLEGRSDPKRWSRLRTAPLPVVHFWVRRSMTPLEPLSNWTVNADDPPNLQPGMQKMRLDTAGRLLYFEAVPASEVRQPQASIEWGRLFEHAGLDLSAFRAVPPQGRPPQHSDLRAAWTGHHPTRPDLRLDVEAASYRGQLVYFEAAGPWREKGQSPRAGSRRSLFMILIVLYFGAIVLAALLAWNNVRRGRGDRPGTLRLTLFVFVARLVYWLFLAHHVPSFAEVSLVVAGLQSAVYWAAIIGLLYLALEPFIRRHWPHGLISWSRLLAGKIGDPLVGRDILIGGAFGVASILGVHLLQFVQEGDAIRFGSLLLYRYGFLGPSGFAPLLIMQLTASIMFPLILAAVVLFFVILTRRNSIAIPAAWLILYAATNLNFGDGSMASYVVAVIVPTIFMVALVRHGLLTLIATFFFMHLWSFYPATTRLSAWYASTWVMQLILLLVITLFAFRRALGSQKLLSDSILDVTR